MSDPVDSLDVNLIRRAWNRKTSANPAEWSPSNRARGQCAITALVVQDCFDDSKLIRTVATLPDGSTESHYATMVEHGVFIDLTDSQFPEGTKYGPWEDRSREYVTSFPETRARYQLLCKRMNELRTLDNLARFGEPL